MVLYRQFTKITCCFSARLPVPHHQRLFRMFILFIVVFSGECGSCDSLLVQRKQFIVQHQCV